MQQRADAAHGSAAAAQVYAECPEPSALPGPDTFFCMTRRTFVVVVVMLLVASVLAAAGSWYFNKSGGAGAGNVGAR